MTDWVVNLIDAGGYWGIVLLMALENIFPPIPSELIMGIGGIRVGQGRMEMLPLLIAGTIGTTIGNYFWYWIGWKLGVERLRPLVRRFGRILTIQWREVEMLNRLFQRHGEKIVFGFRFMPAFRTMVSLPAGLFRMGQVRFLTWTTGGALIWNIILAGSGYVLGAHFRRIDDYLGPLSTAAIGAVVLIYLWRLLRWRPNGDEVA
ncbi:MAG: DedA family protein [Sphingomonadales bacterium]|nr:MAG: DedA family protein [Sphingomonadales bacterium]TNF03849.1 MAG: DedA family protein [Sphingomonadales bacterium]